MVIIGFLLAALVGISLGLIGSGGSILTVPILVYVMGVDPVLATAYSLFIVGSTALVGGVQSAIQKRVDFKTVLIFGVPSIAAVYATRLWLVPLIPAEIVSIGGLVITKSIALMLLFAVVMILASVSMIRPGKKAVTDESAPMVYNYPMILLEGAVVGILTGLVGAGGGFLIIPALVFLTGLKFKTAVGTSLFIIAINSLSGFMGDAFSAAIDWFFLLSITALAVAGIFIGNIYASKISSIILRKTFGWLTLVMGIWILVKETLL